jgi:hypothetical protein
MRSATHPWHVTLNTVRGWQSPRDEVARAAIGELRPHLSDPSREVLKV